MGAYLLRRVPTAVLVLALSTIPIFLMLRLAPGDPAVLVAGPDADADAVAAVRGRLGLDDPLFVQYGRWVWGALRLELGASFITGSSVASVVARGLANTATLTLSALVIALLLALPLGVLSASARRRSVQTALAAVNVVMLAVPTYVTGVVLVLIFAVTLRLLPPGGFESILDSPGVALQYLALPSVCLALPVAAVLSRFLAASLQRVYAEEHYFASTLRGLSRRRLLLRHALPNSIGPVVVILAIQIGQLLGGAVIVEAIFAWPGVGQEMVQGALRRDYPVVQALLLLSVAIFILLQMLSDLAAASIDPRVKERA